MLKIQYVLWLLLVSDDYCDPSGVMTTKAQCLWMTPNVYFLVLWTKFTNSPVFKLFSGGYVKSYSLTTKPKYSTGYIWTWYCGKSTGVHNNLVVITMVVLHLKLPVSLVSEPVCKVGVLLAHRNGMHPLLFTVVWWARYLLWEWFIVLVVWQVGAAFISHFLLLRGEISASSIMATIFNSIGIH